jgi:hypothetical protein
MEQATNGLFRVHPFKDTNHPEFIQASQNPVLFAEHQKNQDISRRRVLLNNGCDQTHHRVIRKISRYIKRPTPTNAHD